MKKILLFLCLTLCAGTIYAKKDKKKDKKKEKQEVVITNYKNALLLAYDRTNSVFEDENIILEIYSQGLWITNKTKKTLFIDLAQCFLTHNGSSRPIFTKDQDERKASKKGVSTSVDEFITVAPSTGAKQNATFVCNVADGIYGKYTTSETPWGEFTDYDKRFIELINDLVTESLEEDPKGKECWGTASRHLLEDESVNNIGASIAYAFNKRAEDWTTVALSTWVSDVIFAPIYCTYPEEPKKEKKKGFGVKETKPIVVNVRASSPFDFDQDKSPLILCVWNGNFKKGTFNLGLLYHSYASYTGKQVLEFQGEDVDWGTMKHVSLYGTAKQEVRKK